MLRSEVGGEIRAVGPVLAALAVLYVATASPYVLGEDNGEFSALYATSGVAHPSGYPLYTSLLHAFAWLPVATPARGAALVTAGVGLAAVALLYGACRTWGAGRGASALAAAFYGTAPLAWDLSTKAEVFALNAAVAAAIALVASPRGPIRGERRAALLGLLFGLGVSNHHSVVLLAPLVAWAAVAAVRESLRRGRALGLLAGGAVLGLAPYAFIPIAAQAPGDAWVWGDVTTFSGVIAHFLRRDYGTTTLAVGAAHPSIFANLGALARTLFVDLRGVGCVVGAVALAIGVARAPRQERIAWTALAGSFLLAGPGFATMMNVELSPEGTAIVRRFHLLPLLLLCVPFALGADWLLGRLRPVFQAALVATALAAGAVLGFGDVQSEHGPMLENYVVDTLRTAPPNAVVLGSGDARVFGVLYVQTALGLRRDVAFVSPILLHHAWYRRRVGRALGVTPSPPRDGSVDTVELAARILASGRRLFLSDRFSAAIPQHFATYPYGTLIEVLPRGTPTPSPPDLEQTNLTLFSQYHLAPAMMDAARAWSRGVRDAYARPWASLADAYRLAGDSGGAARNARRAATLEPWLPLP